VVTAVERDDHAHRDHVAHLDRVHVEAGPAHALQVTAFDLPLHGPSFVGDGQVIQDVRVLPLDFGDPPRERNRMADVVGQGNRVVREDHRRSAGHRQHDAAQQEERNSAFHVPTIGPARYRQIT